MDAAIRFNLSINTDGYAAGYLERWASFEGVNAQFFYK